jgi:hypothetical protein
MRCHRFLPASLAIGATVAVVSAVCAAPQTELRPLDTKEPLTYFIAPGKEGTGYRTADRELASWALGAWQRSAGGALKLEASDESDALIRMYWAEPRDAQYGEMRPLVVGGRRGAALYIRPDVEALGPDIARRARGDDLFRDTIVYLTCVHELGHAFGLAHTNRFDDIMYFFGFGGDIVQYFDRYRVRLRSRADIASLSGLSDADLDRLRKLYPR